MDGSHNCSAQAMCINNIGSYSCICNAGFEGNGLFCSSNTYPNFVSTRFNDISTDINECSDEELNDCRANATCMDTFGSFTCTCVKGFSGNGTSCFGEYIQCNVLVPVTLYLLSEFRC